MSDLSDFVNMDFSADPPYVKTSVPSTEKSQHTGFRWPTPPFAAYPDALVQNQAQGCEFVSTDGQQVCGRLVFFVPDEHVAHVQVPPARTTELLRFDQFRSLRVMEPLKPALTRGEGPGEQMLQQRPRSPYRVNLTEGHSLEGQTIGHVENDYGLFLFPPVDNKGSVQRLFVPRCAYHSYEVGSRIGELLVEQNAVTPQQVEQAADVQKQMRQQRLGDILVQRHVVTKEQLQAAIEKQSRMPAIRFGEALISMGLVTPEQLQEALNQQQQDRTLPLGDLLVRMGDISREDLQNALARKMGYPVVDLNAFPFETEAIRKLPYAVAVRVKVMPLMIREGRLVIAMDDPVRRRQVVDEVEFITQMKVVPVLTQCEHLKAIQQVAYENAGAATALHFVAPNTGAPVPPEMQDSSPPQDETPTSANNAIDTFDDLLTQASETSIESLVNNLIIEAHTQGASDIHIECHPGNDKLKVRFRQDGLMRPHSELPSDCSGALIARIKVMCELDVAERRKPQDGKLSFGKFSAHHRVELRVATIPTHSGLEDVVMHLLASARPMPLDKLGLSTHHRARLQEAVERPHGLVLCVGPASSGKTTTLHSALSHINVPERKIWTAEDPIEIIQPGLRQVQINTKVDWTFAKALRAFMRADPDVIMVSDLRDKEAAQLSLEAALTGHLVLSSLHTTSAAETATRLLDMGLDAFNVADSLQCVLSQRLVRQLCMHCRQSRLATGEEVNELLDDYLHEYADSSTAESRESLRSQWEDSFGEQGRLMWHHSPGCEQCGHTGHRGRTALHELMLNSRELRRLIQTRASAESLRQMAMQEGMRSLRQDGIEKVLSGQTSLAEVRSVSGG